MDRSHLRWRWNIGNREAVIVGGSINFRVVGESVRIDGGNAAVVPGDFNVNRLRGRAEWQEDPQHWRAL